MTTGPFIIERTFNAAIGVVWRAITDKDKMKQWYFDVSAFRPEVGFEFNFSATNKGIVYVHLCKVTAVEKNKLLAYTWSYKDYPGESLVTLELFAEGDKTKVRLTHSGLETFPADNADFKKESFATGWTYIIGKSLKEFVEAGPQ